MRKVIQISVLLLFCSCNILPGTNVFDSDKLKGKYKVDFSALVAKSNKSEDKELRGWAALFGASFEIDMSFYGNQKGVIHLDGPLFQMANAYGDKPIESNFPFEYKVENDSLLYTKMNGAKSFDEFVIIRKYSDNYDYIQLVVVENGKETAFLDLNKISE